MRPAVVRILLVPFVLLLGWRFRSERNRREWDALMGRVREGEDFADTADTNPAPAAEVMNLLCVWSHRGRFRLLNRAPIMCHPPSEVNRNLRKMTNSSTANGDVGSVRMTGQPVILAISCPSQSHLPQRRSRTKPLYSLSPVTLARPLPLWVAAGNRCGDRPAMVSTDRIRNILFTFGAKK